MELIKDLGMLYPNKNSKTKRRYGLYMCPLCLTEFKTQTTHVISGNSTKCVTCARTSHGDSKTRLYSIWIDMKQRCSNPKTINYKNYGGRGISIDPVWDEFIVFKKWALSNGYSTELTIDRKESSGNYKPSNCRFVNKIIQSQNTRLIRKTNTTGYRGVSMTRNKKRFTSQIRDEGKKYLGTFDTAEEAALKYDEYILEHNLGQQRNFQ